MYINYQNYDQDIHRSSFGGFSCIAEGGRKISKSLANHKLTFAFLEHLKASANSGILLTVPSTRNLVGE